MSDLNDIRLPLVGDIDYAKKMDEVNACPQVSEESYHTARATIPPVIKRMLYKKALKSVRGISWEKIRDEITVPVMEEMQKNTEALKDSTNSFIYRSNPTEKLIEEAVTNYLRKFNR